MRSGSFQFPSPPAWGKVGMEGVTIDLPLSTLGRERRRFQTPLTGLSFPHPTPLPGGEEQAGVNSR